nr:elongation of very long chain fatty acids protein 7 [Parasteatoda tepidariorum]XP_042895313.1 elongation of very long chain fatty acids protein 7 [Parasteatoda tepidariorum]
MVIRFIYEYLEDFLIDNTNPVVLTWPLVGNAVLNFGIVGFYLLFVLWLGPLYMKYRKPFDLRRIMVPYNAALVVTNAIIFYHYAKIRYSGKAKVSCEVLERLDDRPDVYKLAEITWYFYISKFVELSDTVFFVLRKKERQLSKLHLIHHSSVPLMMYGLLRSEPGGYNTVFPIANSFVHILMYTYYGISALGDDVTIHLTFKKYITMCQLVQFIFVLYHMFVTPFQGCKISPLSFIMNVLIAGFFMALFLNFYYHEYINRRSNREKEIKNGIDHFTNGKKVK